MSADPAGSGLALPSPVQELRDERLTRRGVRLLLKRDDLIHPEIQGNKWRKLKYNLNAAREGGFSTLLTFGGAYSNHLRATAAAGHHFGFATIGVVRGEEHAPLNSSLRFAAARGMQLTYMDRDIYRHKNDDDVISGLREKYGEFYLLPEGGSNEFAVRGTSELPSEISSRFDVICCPVGTGGTLAGIAGALSRDERAIGFAALKDGEFLNDEVARLQRSAFDQVTDAWSIECGYHFGGFAKSTSELNEFVDDFNRRHSLLLDWVYVAKMMYGIFDLVTNGRFAKGTVVVAVVTGPNEREATLSDDIPA